MSTHKTLLAAGIVLAWLATCAMIAEGQDPTTKRQVVSIPDFRLPVPAGDWSIEQDVKNGHVTLIAQRTSRLGPRGDLRIDVRVVRLDSARAFAPAAAALWVLNREVSEVRAREKGGWTWSGAPRDTTIGCRALVGERYRLKVERRGAEVSDEEGTLYAWAPPDFGSTGRIVLFRLTRLTRGAAGVRLHGDAAFYRVITDLELQSTAGAPIC